MRTVLIVLLFACPLLFGARRQAIVWEQGKVLAQDLGSAQAGAYAGPLAGGVYAVPLYQSWNRITIETETQIYDLTERAGRRWIIVPVNGEIPFYREGNFFILLDTGRKKHKFILTGLRSLE